MDKDKVFIDARAGGKKDGHLVLTKYYDSDSVSLTAMRRHGGKIKTVGEYTMPLLDLEGFVYRCHTELRERESPKVADLNVKPGGSDEK